MQKNEGPCRHKTSFIKWICALEYYGYYKCDTCYEKIYITKEERRKYHNKYQLFVPLLLVSSIISIELNKPYIFLLSLLICIVIYLIYLFIKSPASDKNKIKDK